MSSGEQEVQTLQMSLVSFPDNKGISTISADDQEAQRICNPNPKPSTPRFRGVLFFQDDERVSNQLKSVSKMQ